MKLKSIDTQATEKARSAVDTLVACNLLKAADLKEAEAILRELFRRELNVLHLHEYPELFHPTLIALGITTVDDLRTLALSDFASVANTASKKLDNFVSLIKARHNIAIPSVASKLSTEFASKRSINTIPALVKMNFAGFQSSPKPIRNMEDLREASKDLATLTELLEKAYEAQYPGDSVVARDKEVKATLRDIFNELAKLRLF